MINRAVFPLHLQHPFKLKTNLIQKVKFLKALRNLFIGKQQVHYGFCSSNNVASVVAGIVPAALNVFLFAASINLGYSCMAAALSAAGVCKILKCRKSKVIINILCKLKGKAFLATNFYSTGPESLRQKNHR